MRDPSAIVLRDRFSNRAASCRRSFGGNRREPSLRILSLMNEVVPIFRRSGSLPLHAAEIQISIVSSSFPIVIICQIKELVLDDFDLSVTHSRSGNPIKKVNQSVNRFHTVSTVSDAHDKMRVCLADLNLN